MGLALRFILDALKKSPNTKMYNFGITALDRFKNRLKDFHQYCSHITAIPHFHQFPQHLIEVCYYIIPIYNIIYFNNILIYLSVVINDEYL